MWEVLGYEAVEVESLQVWGGGEGWCGVNMCEGVCGGCVNGCRCVGMAGGGMCGGESEVLHWVQ